MLAPTARVTQSPMSALPTPTIYEGARYAAVTIGGLKDGKYEVWRYSTIVGQVGEPVTLEARDGELAFKVVPAP